MTSARSLSVSALAALVLLTGALIAQDEAPAREYSPEEMEMMEAWQTAMAPGDAHAALAKRAGTWKMRVTMWMSPDAEPMSSEGDVERAMLLNGRVLEERVSSDMMGQPYEGISRTGYDNVTGKYWNTWVDSMSTGLFVSYGEADESGAIVLVGDYADPLSGTSTEVRTVIHPEKDGVEIFEWYEDRGEGEHKTMEIRFERRNGGE